MCMYLFVGKLMVFQNIINRIFKSWILANNTFDNRKDNIHKNEFQQTDVKANTTGLNSNEI